MSSTERPSGPTYSVAARLTLFFVLFFGVVTLAGGVALYQLVNQHVSRELDEDIARDMGEFVRVAGHGRLSSLKEAFASYEKASGKDDCFARLIDPNGNVVVSTHMDSWPYMPLPGEAGPVTNTPKFATVDLDDNRLKARLLSASVPSLGYLQMGVSLEKSESLLAHFRRYGIAVLALILVLGAPAGWWLARRAMAGVEVVTRTARSVADGNFSDRVDVTGYGQEIDGLVRSFNLMVERVQAVMAEMRQVNDNIAHDLRSPLTRIRGLAEHAALNFDGQPEGAELAGTIVEECDRLMQMINTMLDISEAETGVGRLQLEVVDLNDLVAQAVELFAGVAEDHGVQLAFERIPEPLNIRGDRRKLQRALTNLVDNAIKYTPRGGSVRIGARRDGERTEVVVSDTGVGIPAKDLPKIFDRFYRADESRHQTGNGLGLSLAQAVAKAHGGGISVSSQPGVGSVFTLILPN